MPPPDTRLDPEGLYASLGLDPAASRDAIRTAFRRQARILHPDVAGTGDTAAFLAIRRAYDVLSNRERRQRYDQAARQAAANASAWRAAAASMPAGSTSDAAAVDVGGSDWPGAETNSNGPTYQGSAYQGPAYQYQPHQGQAYRSRSGPAATTRGTAYQSMTGLLRRPRISDLPLPIWIGVGAFLGLCILEAAWHLRTPPPPVNAGIKPYAAAVTPLSAGEHRTELYGPNPVQLAGTPNFYVTPATGAAVLWRRDIDRGSYIPIGQLPPFSTVQALRLYRPDGLVEIQYDAATTRFIEAKRLAPGDPDTARRAYCAYNAGLTPYDGERLQQRGQGSGTLQLENRAVQPAVVKLRDATGLAALVVFLGPGGHVELVNVPGGSFRTEFAIGELWSRGCNSFAAGMRASRLAAAVTTERDAHLVVPPEQDSAAAEISDQAFQQE